MNCNPQVSAIIIFYNAEKFIEEAIASVFNQTYQNWELILADDGSADSSTEIALRYSREYPEKLKYVSHEGHRNRGMSATRNLGIRNAKGHYIGFLDADDVWLPHKLTQQVEILDSHPEAAMVYAASQHWYSWTQDPADVRRDFVPRLGVQPDTIQKPPTLLRLALQSKAPTPCPSDILFRRQCVDLTGGFEEETFRGIFEDQAFLAKVYVQFPVFVAASCWDKYRKHPDSCVSVTNRAGLKHTVGLFYLRWLQNYLLEHGVNEPELWKALRQKRSRYRHPHWHRLLSYTRTYATRTRAAGYRLARKALPGRLLRIAKALHDSTNGLQ